MTPDTAGMSTIEETTTTVETPGTEGKSTTAGSDKTQHNSMNAKNRLGVSHSSEANNRRDTYNGGKTPRTEQQQKHQNARNANNGGNAKGLSTIAGPQQQLEC